MVYATVYAGVGSGNLFKTVNNGLTWRPTFDHESAVAIGDIAIAPGTPDIVWVGTGEAQPRFSGYAYPGDSKPSTTFLLMKFASICVPLLLVAACNPAPPDTPPTLAVIDSVRIQESDSLYIATINAIAVAPDGSVFISDSKERQVLHVAHDGSGLTIIAGRGGGPGEVSDPTSLAVLGDSLLVVQNGGRKRLALFALNPLKYRNTENVLAKVGNISAAGNGLLASALAPDSGTAFVEFSNAYMVTHRAGTVPALYRESAPVAQAFGATEVASDGDYVVGVFEVSNTVYRWLKSSGPVDSVVMTATTRRGARPDIIQRLLTDPTKGAELAFRWSVPFAVGALSDNRTAVLLVDPTLEGQNYGGPSYLHVVDWTRHTSCPDIAIPVPVSPIPRYAFAKNELVAIVQHPDGTDGVASWLIRWKIGSGRC